MLVRCTVCLNLLVCTRKITNSTDKTINLSSRRSRSRSPIAQRQLPNKTDRVLKTCKINSKRENCSHSRSLDRRRSTSRSCSRSPDVKRKRNHSRSRSRDRSRSSSRSRSRSLEATQDSLPRSFVQTVEFLKKWKINPRKEHKLVNHLMSKKSWDRKRIMKKFCPTPNRDPANALKAYSQFKDSSSTQR